MRWVWLELCVLAGCAGSGDGKDSGETADTGATDTDTDTGGDTDTRPGRDLSLGAAYATIVGSESSATGTTVSMTPGAAVVSAPFGGTACSFALPLAAGAHALDAGACLVQEADLDYPGWALDATGDANGDGVSDLLLGAVGSDELGPDAGKAYLVYGPLPAAAGSLATAPVSWLGEARLDYAGSAVAFSDVDGDGDSDVLVGAQANAAGGVGGGRVYLFRAPVEGGAYGLGEAAVTITGLGPAPEAPPHGAPSVGDGAGSVLAGAGDFDGDGMEDVLIGANGADDLAFDGGAAALFLGPIADGDHALREADRLWVGGTEGLYVGDSVARAGDVDGDGYGDVILGGDSQGPGTVWLVHGPGTVGTLDIESAETSFVGEVAGNLAGAYTAPAGDVDGDGWADLLIGAYGVDLSDYNEGAAYLVRGPFAAGTILLADSVTRWVGPGDGAVAGSAVAGGADVDGDGLPDLLVGARYSSTGGDFAGEAYLIVP
ncbi:MAG: integrin alpha [Pseudomonadota bacterium]|nr:integrin alpha [Pseudomonadota bacterium]